MTVPCWLTNEQFARIEPHLPTDVRGKSRVDDQRVISGIAHVLRSGGRWCDLPECYGPKTTIYNRFKRWAERDIWTAVFEAFAAEEQEPETLMLDAPTTRRTAVRRAQKAPLFLNAF
ncbi:transposase [Acuticoccus sp. 2012]|uniref:Transposase n=1 Tax=Acuticoccus mangrovi TaxID=2796142 RepID=A0A934IN69_9HYPH|nr:transposase [Acuticoccus mangrovi]